MLPQIHCNENLWVTGPRFHFDGGLGALQRLVLNTPSVIDSPRPQNFKMVYTFPQITLFHCCLSYPQTLEIDFKKLKMEQGN